MKRPNILFILTDQQSRSTMSIDGDGGPRTPHLDALARGGVRFDNAYCTSPVCGPARAGLMTGTMPHTCGVEFLDRPIREDVPTLGEVFSTAGYETAYAGKWHLPEAYVTGDRMRGFRNLPVPLEGPWWLGTHIDDAVVDRAEAFLRQPHDRPFLLTVSLHNPHDICHWITEQDRDVLERFNTPGQRPPLPANFEVDGEEPDFIRACRQREHYGGENAWTINWTERDWRDYLNVYHRLVEHVDERIGRLLAMLREQGLEEDTLVVFTSDHGEGMAAHRWVVKLMLFEETAAVPFLIRWPGRIPAGIHDTRHLVSGADLLPTLCDYAGMTPPAGVQGRSLRPVIEHPESAGAEYVVCELQPDTDRPELKGRMLRTKRYKYIAFSHGERPEMLFDMERDPGEMRNLAASADHATELLRHRRLLADWLRRTNDAFEQDTMAARHR